MKPVDLVVAHALYTSGRIRAACMDLAPIVLVIAFFQLVVIQKPLPELGDILLGTVLVVLGLSMFIEGLERALFPLGEGMAHALSRKGSLLWLLVFSFALGFSTTVAEPALIAVSGEAADIAADGGLIDPDARSRGAYSLGLRLTVACSVGCVVEPVASSVGCGAGSSVGVGCGFCGSLASSCANASGIAKAADKAIRAIRGLRLVVFIVIRSGGGGVRLNARPHHANPRLNPNRQQIVPCTWH